MAIDGLIDLNTPLHIPDSCLCGHELTPQEVEDFKALPPEANIAYCPSCRKHVERFMDPDRGVDPSVTIPKSAILTHELFHDDPGIGACVGDACPFLIVKKWARGGPFVNVETSRIVRHE